MRAACSHLPEWPGCVVRREWKFLFALVCGGYAVVREDRGGKERERNREGEIDDVKVREG